MPTKCASNNPSILIVTQLSENKALHPKMGVVPYFQS